MRHHARPLAVIALAAASVMFAGCDGPQSQNDKQVYSKLDQAALAATNGPTTQSVTLDTQAAAVQGASLEAKTSAKAAAGLDSYSQAVAMLRDLDKHESAALGDLQHIQSALELIASNNLQVKTLSSADPAATIKTLDQTKARHDAEAAAADNVITKTQGEIAAKQTQIQQTQGKLDTSKAQAADLFQKSEAARGKDSVDLFNKATAVRAESQKLAYELDGQKLELAQLQTTLSDARNGKQLAQQAAAATQSTIDALNTNWAQTQKELGVYAAASKTILTDQIAPLAKDYAEELAQAASIRHTIENRLDKSVSSFQGAARDAAELSVKITKREQDQSNASNPSREAWASLKRTLDPLYYNILRAKATFVRGSVNLNLFQLLQQQQQLLTNDLSPTLTQAKLMGPAELTPSDLTKQIADARQAAEDAFKDADGVFELGLDSVIPAQRDECIPLRMATQYGIFTITGGAPNLQKAREALARAADLGIPIPRLPDDLEKGNRAKRANVPVPQVQPLPATGGTQGAVPPPPGPGPVTPPANSGGGFKLPDLTKLLPGSKKE